MHFYSGIGAVLMLHRIQPTREGGFSPNRDMAVSPSFLESFVRDAQQRGYTFVSLDCMSEQLEACSGEKLLALTFDDGYRDNFTLAYPLLRRLQVPFAVYVTTSFPDGGAVLWWEAIEQLLLEHDQVELADGCVLACRTSQEKLDAFVSLRASIMALPGDRLADRINNMFAQVKFDWQQLCATHAMQWDEVCELAQDPLVTIGAHTLSHPVLCSLSPEQASAEMQDSRDRLEARIGTPVTHFCYPFGSRNEVGVREFELARMLGFKTATTTRWGNIFRAHRAHLHALPRVPLTHAFTWNGYRQQSLRRFWRGRVVSA
ncbi:polysaccharide deacetylase family protein [Laribacter hongkongensis]|uniref:polysaccharide deacetylase family protein n=1 Tax=Laribacter hongkongensis TaxID=168471 RepID=UPI0018776816|nr:polysaccharide deacetylase family protein [Laribacter hongkongensis]